MRVTRKPIIKTNLCLWLFLAGFLKRSSSNIDDVLKSFACDIQGSYEDERYEFENGNVKA